MASGQNFVGYDSSADPIFNSERLSQVLQIKYSQGVYGQISEEHKEYEMIKKMKVGEETGRSLNFQIQKDFGPSAIGATTVDEYVFKEHDQPTLEEKAAFMKAKGVTLGISLKLLKRSKKSPKFENPLKVEVDSKATAQKRLLCGELHKDGSAIYGKIASHGTGSDGDTITITLASGRGGEARAIEIGDKLVFKTAAGADAVTNLVDGRVVDKDRIANSVDVVLNGAAVTANDLDNDYIFRKSDVDTIPGGAGALAAAVTAEGAPSGVEFDKLSLNLCGFETLYADDGRKVHDITMSGVTKGTNFAVGGTPISLDDLYGALDKVKIINGSKKSKYTQLLAANETLRSVIDGQEQDRRLNSASDKQRGFSGFVYTHNDSSLEMLTTEYVRDDRIWSIPESKEACIMVGTDYAPVELGNQKDFMSISSGNRSAGLRRYMEADMVYISKRPSLALKISDFTV
jgi:hypothetical protein